MRTTRYNARWIVQSLAGVTLLASVACGAFDFDYFGLEPPGLEKKRFSPQISGLEGREVFSVHFTPDGRECYLVTKAGDTREVFLTKNENGGWTALEPIRLPEGTTAIKGFSPDGTRLYFVIRRKRMADVYVATRSAEGWSPAKRLPEPVNHEQGVIGLAVGAHEDLYFCSWRPPSQGACDVWRAKRVDGAFPMAENLTVLNTPTSECSIVSGPNDSFVVFYSWRPGGFGQADLYVSFPKGESWTAPKNVGPRVNTASGEVPQTMSPDGKYLFFYSERGLCWIETRAVLPVVDGAIVNANTGQRFGSLQCAIHYANDGDALVIPPGSCSEPIDLAGKDIVLRSTIPSDPDPAADKAPIDSPTCTCRQ